MTDQKDKFEIFFKVIGLEVHGDIHEDIILGLGKKVSSCSTIIIGGNREGDGL